MQETVIHPKLGDSAPYQPPTSGCKLREKKEGKSNNGGIVQ